jgi:flagellar hook assembly protein FlgD
MPKSERVRITIYDPLGRRIIHLMDERATSGFHEIRWDGNDQSGNPAPDGVYIYRMEAAGFVQSKKMLLVR